MGTGYKKVPPMADIWGDTVDLRSLSGAIVIGVALGGGAFIVARMWLQAALTSTSPGLISAYALLAGILGCLLAAVVSANVFKPRRKLSEEAFSEEDRMVVLKELQVDMEREARELQTIPREVAEEMQQLHIYDLFAGHSGSKKEDK
jgi:hypothetical protein